MKKSIFYILIAVILLLASCTKEEAIPVTAAFDIEIVDNDYSVPVYVRILNQSSGAETCQWNFEGGSPAASTKANPGVITYETPGTYTLTLLAANADGSEGQATQTISIDSAINIDFSFSVVENSNPPVEINITNNTLGATGCQWTFEGGNPATSTQRNPGKIVFAVPGTHTITLEVTNGKENYSLEKTLTVNNYLSTDFDWTVAFEDEDLEVPVTLTMNNLSENFISLQWAFEGGTPATSTDTMPVVVFDTPGIHNIQLTASNGKTDQTITKTIETFANRNLWAYTDIKLGVNTAHKNNTTGSFFSAQTRKIYTHSEITDETGPLIDLVFFGLSQNFTFNLFAAPDNADSWSFEAIPGAAHTKVINRLDICGCGISFTVAQFDQMNDDTLLQGLTITETANGLKSFDNSEIPRIIIFETADGRKGAVKIKSFVPDGQNSYVVVDIKIQKVG